MVLGLSQTSSVWSMQRKRAQFKVEGEHSEDTPLAAVLVSWFTTQVIYKGVGFNAAHPIAGKLQRRIGNMTDVKPPEVTVVSVPREVSRGRKSAGVVWRMQRGSSSSSKKRRRRWVCGETGRGRHEELQCSAGTR